MARIIQVTIKIEAPTYLQWDQHPKKQEKYCIQ